MTVQRRKITASGVKPVGPVQWRFLYRWLYGVIDPIQGEHFMLEFSHLDGICFERFLQRLSQAYPNELHVIQLDNAPAHISGSIEIPENIRLLFQPPYSPELNPIERVWLELKRSLAWRHFESLEQLQSHISLWVQQLEPQTICSLTQWDWLVDALCVARI